MVLLHKQDIQKILERPLLVQADDDNNCGHSSFVILHNRDHRKIRIIFLLNLSSFLSQIILRLCLKSIFFAFTCLYSSHPSIPAAMAIVITLEMTQKLF